jgi:2-polyprenyl-3-methyl-5-hydroxy-6-metoxy-1,4-benzoquinol methylase
MAEAADLFEFKHVECPVCGEDKPRYVGERGGEAHHAGLGVRTTIVRCRNCSHQYPDPMPFLTVGLEEIYVEPDEYFQRHNLDEKKNSGLEVMKMFEKRLGRKGDFLDVGCGRGELIWAAKERGWNYEGIDPSPEFIEFGRKHLYVEGKIGTLADAAFNDQSFDAVAMGGIIEHLYEPAQVLKEVHRILRPGGWLFFDAPNEDGLYMTLGNVYMKLRRKSWVVVLAPTFTPFHVQGFNSNSVKTLLLKTNFAVRDFRIFGKISPQLGVQSARKRLEYQAGKVVNWIGNATGRGMYMYVWAQKA